MLTVVLSVAEVPTILLVQLQQLPTRRMDKSKGWSGRLLLVVDGGGGNGKLHAFILRVWAVLGFSTVDSFRVRHKCAPVD